MDATELYAELTWVDQSAWQIAAHLKGKQGLNLRSENNREAYERCAARKNEQIARESYALAGALLAEKHRLESGK